MTVTRAQVRFFTALVLSALAFSVLAAEPAWADITTPPSGSTLATATPTVGGTGTPGAMIDVVAQNLVDLTEPAGCTATVTVYGTWTCVLGPVLPPGRYRFTAADVTAFGVPVTQVSDVTVDLQTLARTPAGDPLPYLHIGVALILCGVALVLAMVPPRLRPAPFRGAVLRPTPVRPPGARRKVSRSGGPDRI
jgi:hypothetical protein